MNNNIFDQRAKNYEKLDWVKDNEYSDKVIEKLNIRTGKETILDIGPGTMPVSKKLLEIYPNLNIVCIEPSQEMIQKIIDWMNEKPERSQYSITLYSNYDFLNINNPDTDYLGYIFDRVLIRNVLHHFKNEKEIELVLKCILKYTNKSGIIVIGEGCPPYQIYDGCGIYTEKNDVELSEKILSMKENRLNFSLVYSTICKILKELDIYYRLSYLKTNNMSVNNWLNNGSILKKNKKEEIKDIFKNMDDKQKERFGVIVKDDDIFINFNHIIIYV